MMDEGVEIWRGGVNTWECDEMGHMNVRFYVARAMEGLAGLARHLGMSDAFAADAASTLMVQDHHIRFLREARAGAPLHMRGGVVEMGESTATVVQVIFHTRSGEPAATIITRLVHAGPDPIRAFAWPLRSKLAAERLKVAIPDYAKPRSISGAAAVPTASLSRADALNLTCIGRGALRPQECDIFGRMRNEELIGRISDGVPNLLGQVRTAVADAATQKVARIGGAVLEYRLVYKSWPRAGDHLELRSGLAGIEEKTQRMIHWLLDPSSGEAWASAEAVAVNLDLDARKIVPIAPEARKALLALIVPGLTL